MEHSEILEKLLYLWNLEKWQTVFAVMLTETRYKNNKSRFHKHALAYGALAYTAFARGYLILKPAL
jgi:hypothetical protein